MATYSKLPSGNWRAQFIVDGKRRSLTRPTRRECAKAVELFEGIDAADMTVGRAIEEYISAREGTFSPSTLYGYRNIQRYHFSELTKRPLADVNEALLNSVISAEAKKYSPKTVRNAWGLLRASLSPHLPVDRWRIQLPQKAKKEISVPTDEEVRALLERAAGTDMELPIRLAAFCGLRRSEICALTFGDVRNGYVTIDKAMVMGADRKYHVKKPKSYAGYRTIKLPSNIDVGTGEPSERLTRLTPNNLSDNCLIMSHRQISMHQLRHYYASVLLKLGVPNKYAARQMGHSGEEMLQRVYQHLFPEQSAEYDARIAEAVSTDF